MAKKKVEEVTKSWVRVDDVDKSEPSAEITLASVIQFRNGLSKVCQGKRYKPGTITATMMYRAMLDVDHIARLLDAENRRHTMTMTYVIKPADAKAAVKMAKEMRSPKWKQAK